MMQLERWARVRYSHSLMGGPRGGPHSTSFSWHPSSMDTVSLANWKLFIKVSMQCSDLHTHSQTTAWKQGKKYQLSVRMSTGRWDSEGLSYIGDDTIEKCLCYYNSAYMHCMPL